MSSALFTRELLLLLHESGAKKNTRSECYSPTADINKEL